MPLIIQSSARVQIPWARLALFGEQDTGKTMSIATAPNPVWLNTEPSRKDSLVTENISAVFGPPPTKDDIIAWLKENDPKLKGKELETRIAGLVSNPYEMTGLNWDIPTMEVFDYAALTQAIETLKSPAAAKFETVFLDSASNANKMVLENELNKKTKGGNKADGRMAYKKMADEVFTFFEELFKLPKHVVLVFHASEFSHNIGTKDDPVWQRELAPTFHGNKLKREAHHLFSNIFQVVKGRLGSDGNVLYIDDQGKPIRSLRCRPTTPQGVERTLCPRIGVEEPIDLTEIFSKLKGDGS